MYYHSREIHQYVTGGALSLKNSAKKCCRDLPDQMELCEHVKCKQSYSSVFNLKQNKIGMFSKMLPNRGSRLKFDSITTAGLHALLLYLSVETTLGREVEILYVKKNKPKEGNEITKVSRIHPLETMNFFSAIVLELKKNGRRYSK